VVVNPSGRRAHGALVAAAFVFGTTFVVVKDGTDDLTVPAFLAIRFVAAVLVLLPFARLRPEQRRPVLKGGAVAGTFLLIGYLLQTTGLRTTSTSNSAFITGLFVVFTPLISAVVFRRFPARPTSVGVALATLGLFLFTGAHFHLSGGDALTLGCAVAFAGNIVTIAHLAPRLPTIPLNVAQLSVVAAGSLVATGFTGVGKATAGATLGALFCGVVVSAVGFTLMVFGQSRVPPARSALLLALEPVFAGILGYVVGDRLPALAFVGAGLILLGIVVSEVGPNFYRPATRADNAPNSGSGPATTRPDSSREKRPPASVTTSDPAAQSQGPSPRS
jgi:drug/metabolite transporter (DMT)-like permease